MNSFYIWTIGCQMNRADSEDLAGELGRFGYHRVTRPEEADIVVLNSCVVRQSAEDKVTNKLSNLKALKRKRPETALVLTGCMVPARTDQLKESFPHVDFFLRPQQLEDLLAYAEKRAESIPVESVVTPSGSPMAFVNIIKGCDNFCSYCIVPYRRGREKSRPMAQILDEIQQLVQGGVKEVSLLGQNVDSYGHDLPGKPDLADLLSEVNQIEGLERIRFLTSHPKDMSQKLIEAIASLEKVCEHISLPVQAGDNQILQSMRRGYTVEQYRGLISRIRSAVPEVALSNDIIVGFPGETEAQFQRTFGLLEELRFDTVHVAAYSPRPGTIAWRRLEDDVPSGEKQQRLKQVEELQEQISREKNARLRGEVVQVLVERRRSGRWQGRTRGDKLVFFEDENNCLGELVDVKVEQAGAWSLQGTPAVPSKC
ncbi:MAG: tRNA (N6-isopentenyl adenosine(37)-C2)-methylthiotransferase MiaB [Dehalococcoidia bacterium]